jgi:hypothetical protein
MSAPSEWYGFNIDDEGFVDVDERVDLQDLLRKEREAVEVITLLDDHWGAEIVNDPIIELRKFGQTWLKKALVELWEHLTQGPSVERLANAVVREFDVVEEEPEAYVQVTTQTLDTTVTVFGKVVKQEKKVTPRTRLVKGCRTKFSCSIAKQVYTKFGNRPMSEANMLVTRKYLVKLLEDPKYCNLRTVDKNVAIDRALFLSFVPTKEFLQMKLVFETNAVRDRMSSEKETLFGRIFRVSGVPDT